MNPLDDFPCCAPTTRREMRIRQVEPPAQHRRRGDVEWAQFAFAFLLGVFVTVLCFLAAYVTWGVLAWGFPS